MTGIGIREFARREGCSHTLVERKIASGHLITLPDGKLDQALVGTAWRKSNATIEEDDPEIELEPGIPLKSKAEAERIKENYVALHKRLNYEEAAGKVVAVDMVGNEIAAEYAVVRNALLGLGAKIAPRAAFLKEAPAVKALIDSEVREILEGLTLDVGTDADSIRNRFGKPSVSYPERAASIEAATGFDTEPVGQPPCVLESRD